MFPKEVEVACLFVNVLQRPIRVLAIANTMASHAGLACPFLSFDQHVVSTFGEKEDVGIVNDFGRQLGECSKRCEEILIVGSR